MKKALLTGVTGQDGPYLAEFLRGETCVTRKITRALARNKFGLQRTVSSSATWTPGATGAMPRATSKLVMAGV